MKRIIAVISLVALVAFGAFAADLTIEAQFDITGKVPAKSFLTVRGPTASVEKDTIDVATGASKAKGTEVLNTYRSGADKKGTLPGGLQSLFKYGVSPEKAYTDDGLNAAKAKDGTITIQYVHRGTAYLMVSDAKGRFTLPGAACKSRKIANLEVDGSQLVSKDFSSTGKVAGVNWAKVWDASIPDGTLITTVKAADGKTTEVKTGKIVDDVAPSSTPYVGYIDVTLTGTLMTMKSELTLKK